MVDKKRVALIDADFIKYLVVYDIQKMYERGLNPEVEIPYSTVVQLIEKRLEKIFKDTEPYARDYYFLFSGKTKDNHRWLIAETSNYKGNRKYKQSIPKEGSFRNIVEEYIAQNYHYHKEDTLEADDLCVMAHNDDTFIYSNDKDLRVSPGMHFDIKLRTPFRVTKGNGFRTLLKQSLTGDTVDNIAGKRGVGKVGANKIIDNKTPREALMATIEKFTEDGPLKDGFDTFVEMYSLVNLRTDRGKWTNERYSEFFSKLYDIIDGKANDDLL